LATESPELVSVADIANRAGLTSAAIYYHFASREELVDELVEGFGGEWAEVLTAEFQVVSGVDDVAGLVDTVMDWLEQRSERATVYFISSVGTTNSSETKRRATRYAQVKQASALISRLTADLSSTDRTVRALGLVLALEVAAANVLRPDPVYRTLGKARFRRTITAMVRKVFV
jgi:AcrR family transcriptional regulator